MTDPTLDRQGRIMTRRPVTATPARRQLAPAAAGGASSLLRLSASGSVLPRAAVLSTRRDVPLQMSLFGPAGRASLR